MSAVCNDSYEADRHIPVRHAKVVELDLGLDPAFALLRLLLCELFRLSAPTLLSLSPIFSLSSAVLQLLSCRK